MSNPQQLVQNDLQAALEQFALIVADVDGYSSLPFGGISSFSWRESNNNPVTDVGCERNRTGERGRDGVQDVKRLLVAFY